MSQTHIKIMILGLTNGKKINDLHISIERNMESIPNREYFVDMHISIMSIIKTLEGV